MNAGWIQYEHWNASGFVKAGMLPVRDIQKCLKEFEMSAKKLLDETKADHIVYARKQYDEYGDLCKICFYEGTALSDKEFYDKAGKTSGIVYALHRRK